MVDWDAGVASNVVLGGGKGTGQSNAHTVYTICRLSKGEGVVLQIALAEIHPLNRANKSG